jgi:sugar lactone lactonase YvrE
MDRRPLAVTLGALLALLPACGPSEIVVGDQPGLARVVAGVPGDSALGAAEGDARREALAGPSGIAAVAGGTLYIADTGNRVVRVVSPGGVERIVAGDVGCLQTVFAPVRARALCLQLPTAVAAFPSGDSLLVVDRRVHVVWLIDLRADSARPFFGTGTRGRADSGAVARTASTSEPDDVAVGPDGTVYVVEVANHRIVAIARDGRTGDFVVRPAVGRGDGGYSGDGAEAVRARLLAPRGVAVGDGELYVADTGNQVIRRVTADGRISTVAGSGQASFGGDGGPALSAQFNQPVRVALVGRVLIVADRGNRRVRAVQLGSGLIGAFLGNGDSALGPDLLEAGLTTTSVPAGLAQAQGFLYAADAGHHVVRRIFVP